LDTKTRNDEKMTSFPKSWYTALMKFKINLQKLVDTCGYELPTNFQNFVQKYLNKLKIFQ